MIHVACHAEGDRLLRIHLSCAPTFSYAILGAAQSLESILATWLDSYAAKNPNPFPFQIPSLTPFQRSVLSELVRVPFGTTLSYQDLAKKCGSPKGARAIGSACKRNPFPLLIPCHRIICADGSLGGFALDRKIKQRLLAFEGKEL